MVGLRNRIDDMGNVMLGVTVAPDEIKRYVKLVVRDPILGQNPKVLFGDVHDLRFYRDSIGYPRLRPIIAATIAAGTLIHLEDYKSLHKSCEFPYERVPGPPRKRGQNRMGCWQSAQAINNLVNQAHLNPTLL
jgi:hypothetical protein